jgi:MarR family transcriptional regulator, organic hydroperoxide resistance regulator
MACLTCRGSTGPACGRPAPRLHWHKYKLFRGFAINCSKNALRLLISPAGETMKNRSLKVRGRARNGKSSDRRDPLEMAVLQQFRLIFRSAKKHFQWVQERAGVSGAQLWLLAEIERRPGIRVTDVAKSMAVHQSTASNLIERLEKDRLLLRQRSSQDQRVVHLSLTKAGRATVARAPRPLYGVLRDALGSLEETDLAQLQDLLEKLASKMKVRDRAGKRIPLAEM